MKMTVDYGEIDTEEGAWMRIVRVSLCAAVAALVICVPAFASGNNTLTSAYGSTPHNVSGVVKTTTKPAAKPTAVKTSGTLPFTGVDLGVVAGAAVLLLGVGLAFRRLGRQPS